MEDHVSPVYKMLRMESPDLLDLIHFRPVLLFIWKVVI